MDRPAAVDEWPTPGGEAANGTSGVIASVNGGQGTIGYADESQAGKLGHRQGQGRRHVRRAVGRGRRGRRRQLRPGRAVAASNDLAISVNRTTTSADEYPVVLVSYHIGCVQYDDKAKADAVKAFENYVISEEGQKAAASAAGQLADHRRTPGTPRRRSSTPSRRPPDDPLTADAQRPGTSVRTPRAVAPCPAPTTVGRPCTIPAPNRRSDR